MKRKVKQVHNISPEERLRMSERMKIAQKKRWENRSTAPTAVTEGQAVTAVLEPTEKQRDPEVQAIIDSMTPERRAKLQMLQSKQLSTQEGQEALARHEAEKLVVTRNLVVEPSMPPARIGSREVSIIVRTNGTMVSQYGPCLCGAMKREWHKICLKEILHG
jgi:hypothetical protein